MQSYCLVWIRPILFTHSLADGYSGYSHLFATTDNAAISIRVQALMWIYVVTSPGLYLWSHCVLTALSTCQNAFHSSHTIWHPCQQHASVPLWLCHYSQPSRCERRSPVGTVGSEPPAVLMAPPTCLPLPPWWSRESLLLLSAPSRLPFHSLTERHFGPKGFPDKGAVYVSLELQTHCCWPQPCLPLFF